MTLFVLVVSLIVIVSILTGTIHFLIARSATVYHPSSLPQLIPSMNFPIKKGEHVHHKFAPESFTPNETIRVVSLNMERGKQFDKIVQQLEEQQADIIFLQEVDYFVKRTGSRDYAGELATRLKMNSYFICEFEEISMMSPYAGCEGNAILSKFSFKEAKSITVAPRDARKMLVGIDRIFPYVEMDICGTRIGCSSIHLDPHFTGVGGRSRQFRDLIQALPKYHASIPLMIAGDFNTVCTGIGRLNIPKISPNWNSAFGQLGTSEATRFQKETVEPLVIEKQKQYPNFSLHDPFDKEKDVTFIGMSGLFAAKLDWCLASDFFIPVHTKVGSAMYQHCSDHCWIAVDYKIRE